ncbi:hypothetical protein F5J12DRAFT_928867 [Pisolithus orientalis]|uniref:uncharacterized protein n=1 Tax=Pisolithus orientalis TaxID=936130 RepID=UPI0022256215|nr:uncharacterized protein F5J12DRAFT_928867 [Pisolithus orientalis]KAI5998326.1 hypothetical protein F5J12DRAFT_928867 [Pisolithus orientalis]
MSCDRGNREVVIMGKRGERLVRNEFTHRFALPRKSSLSLAMYACQTWEAGNTDYMQDVSERRKGEKAVNNLRTDLHTGHCNSEERNFALGPRRDGSWPLWVGARPGGCEKVIEIWNVKGENDTGRGDGGHDRPIDRSQSLCFDSYGDDCLWADHARGMQCTRRNAFPMLNPRVLWNAARKQRVADVIDEEDISRLCDVNISGGVSAETPILGQKLGESRIYVDQCRSRNWLEVMGFLVRETTGLVIVREECKAEDVREENEGHPGRIGGREMD